MERGTHGMKTGGLTEQPIHGCRDGGSITERHEHTVPIGEELLGMPVGGAHHSLAGAIATGQGAGGDLGRIEIGSEVDISRTDVFNQLLVPGEDQTIDNGGSTLNLLALEALTDSVIGYGGDKVLIASKAARRQISTASRQAGGDLYEVIDGRHYFEGIEILLVEEDAEGHAVLGYDEPAGTTSIYCCVLGDAAVCGLQGPFEGRYGIAVRDFGEVHDAPVFRTRVDWYVGFAVCNRKAAARLFNVAPMPLVLP